MLRELLKDVEPDWQGHVSSGNCEDAEGEGDPETINTANRLYALWERLYYIPQLPITYLPPPSLADHEESDGGKGKGEGKGAPKIRLAEETGGEDADHSQAPTLKFYSSVGKDDDDEEEEEEDAMARMAQPHLDQSCAKTGKFKQMIAEENEAEEEEEDEEEET